MHSPKEILSFFKRRSVLRLMFTSLAAVLVFSIVGPSVALAKSDKNDKNGDEPVATEEPVTEQVDGDDAVVFLEPLDDNTGGGDLDQTLTDYITVSIYKLEDSDWVLFQEYTSDGTGSEVVRLAGNHYEVNWHKLFEPGTTPSGNENAPGQNKDDGSVQGKGNVLEGEFRIVVSVAGMEVESFDVVLSNDTGKKEPGELSERGSVPIKFIVNNEAEIRARILTEEGYSAGEIAAMLLDEFGLTPEQTAQLLFNEGFSAEQTGNALKEVFGLDALETTVVLKAVGFTAGGVGLVLANVYLLSAEQTGAVMKSGGYTIGDIWMTLSAIWTNLTTGDLITLSDNIGILVEQIAYWLNDGLHWTIEQVLDILFIYIPDTFMDICNWLAEATDWTYQQMVTALYAAGALASQVGEWLLDAAGWTVNQIVTLLNVVGYGAALVGDWLWNGLQWTGEQIVSALTAAGYFMADIAGWFMDGLEWTGEQFAALLDYIGYGAEYIANILMDVFNMVADGIGYILEGLGYAADFISDLLGDIFGTVICTELHRQGYLTGDIYEADVKFGVWLEQNMPLVRRGYQWLAGPIVRQMQNSKAFTEAVYFFAKPWAEDMAYREGALDHGNFWGAIIMYAGIPLCFIAGIFVTIGYPSVIILLMLLLAFIAYRRGYFKDLAMFRKFGYINSIMG